MATITKRTSRGGQITYRARVRLRGFPTQSASFRRRTDAKRWAQKIESDIREGLYFPTTEAKQRTLAELIDEYLEVVTPNKPGSARDQTRQLNWWKKQLGDYSLALVTADRIAQERNTLSKGVTPGGTPRSPSTVNRYLAALSHVFTFGLKELRWVAANPVKDVTRPREPRGRVRYLKDDEQLRLLQACRASGDRRLFPLVMLALGTGARQGELLRLRWADIDLNTGVVLIHETKNTERRALTLTSHTIEPLRALGEVRHIDTDLVFANHSRKAYFPRKPWQKALSEAQINDFRFHDLRHSAASYLAMSGATLAEIAEVLGHKTLAMVKRYSHLTEQHTSKVVARMNEQIFG